MKQTLNAALSSSEMFSHPGYSTRDFAGPVYDLIERELSTYLEYQMIRDGRSSTSQYLHFIDEAGGEPFTTTLTENQRHLVARFPQSEEALVDQALERLRSARIIHSTSYPKDQFMQFRERVRRTFNHGGYVTFIFPEEERLVFALSQILQPKNVLFLGSYYGYWGIWMLPAVMQKHGHATFVDPNPHTNAVARANLSSLGFAGCATVVEAEGTHFLQAHPSRSLFDFLLLDAEGPDNAPDPGFRGKRVYFPLIAKVLPHLSNQATVVTHNILLQNQFRSPYFDRLITKNAEELQEFVAFTTRNFSRREVIDTTEGIGVYSV
jgi:predicted O-methyltransferase YrrM